MKKNLISKTLFLAMGLCAASGITTTLVSTNKSNDAVYAETPKKIFSGELPETIAINELLPDGFPINKSSGWVSTDGKNAAYLYADTFLKFEDINDSTTNFLVLAENTASLSNGNYIYEVTDMYDVKCTFVIKDGVLVQIEFVSSYTSALNGTYTAPKMVADVLPDNFPDSKEKGWTNDKGSSIYCDSTNFYVDNGEYLFTLDKTAVLTNSSTNYVYYYDSYTAFYFNMEDGEMTSFFVSCLTSSTFYGTYTHTHSYEIDALWDEDEVTLTGECSCGDVQSDTFTATYQQVAGATCTAPEKGKYVLTIEEGMFAGTYESDQFDKGEPLGHDTSKINGQTATCFKDGWRDAYFCCECNKYFEDEECSIEIENFENWKKGAGKIEAHHQLIKLDEKPATCTTDGWKARYQCEICELFFEDEQATILIGEDTEIINWASNEGKIAALGHHGVKQDGKPATCTEAGWMDYYKCDRCDAIFTDSECINEIVNLDAWKSADGKINPLGHHGVKQDGKAATYTEAGWMNYYKCEFCGKFFTEIECINEITDLEAWKIGAGMIEKLPEPIPEETGLSGGAIAGIVIGSTFVVGLGAFAIVWFGIKKKSFADLIAIFKKQ